VSRQRAAAFPSPAARSIAAWRHDRLLLAGFAPGQAAALAADRTIDLHALLELIDRGCPPELAARILAPLERPNRPSP